MEFSENVVRLDFLCFFLNNFSVLSVIREQYCCCSRWSKCEKMLLLAVGILAFFILVLGGLVGYFAGTKGESPTFVWSL